MRAGAGKEDAPSPGEERTLMFRPESVRFDAAESDLNSFSAEIRESWFLGEITQTSLAAGSFVFTANEQAAPDRAHDSSQSVRIDPEHLVVLSPDPEED
jgi:ABC-type Fe3+/spermidine/putrescine transport system ATPase subunit